MSDDDESLKSTGKKGSKSRSKSRTRSKSRSKSSGRSKSPGKLKTRSKSKARKSFGWWDLENDPELIAALEAEGLAEKARIADDEAAMARRQEIVRKFKEDHEAKMKRAEEERKKPRGVAARFLNQVQQKQSETKPVVMKSVRASVLKIDISSWEAPKYKKDNEEKAVIKNTTKKHFLFKDNKENTRSSMNLNTGIASGTVAMLLKAFQPVKVDKGKAIIQQGKLDQHMYVVQNGAVEIQLDDMTVATGNTGMTFGDQNLLHAVPAKRTVLATEDTKVFRLHQDAYRGIMRQGHEAEKAKKLKKEKEKKEKEMEKEIEKEKEKEKLKKEKGKEKEKVKEPEAKKPEISEEEKPEIPEEEKTTEESPEEWWKDNENAQLQISIRDALQNVHLDELERIKVLGEGQYGEVWLVAADIETVHHEDEPRRYEFALKIQQTYEEFEQEIAASEIRIMKEVSGHPFISMLYRSYESDESMDMVLGLIPGGELWDTVHKEDEATGDWVSGLSEGDARFYTMTVADTLDHLHSNGFIFRDLKPENIMIDGWGYPVIVDFGFCKRLKKGPTDKTFTFCGTPNYVSPEIVLNVGHNGGADCWALGIVIFEMISGENPFFYDDIDQVELYRSICEDVGLQLDDKKHSRQVRKLVDKLLTKDPNKRLDAKGVLEQPWFEGLSLKRLRRRQVRAPWIPPGGEGENAEYYDDSDEENSAMKKREKEVEEELLRRQQEEEERERLRLEEEERQRQEELRIQMELEEEQRLEEEERQRLEEIRIQKELEEQQRLEEEERQRREEEEELRIQMELEEQERLEEEERQEQERLEEEERQEQLRLEEEERQEQLRLEEEERLEQLRLEEEERQEQLRLEEEERQEQLRLEEEERQEQLRLEEEERQRELEEEEQREEEERQREEELRLQKELEEQQRRDEEKHQRQEELRRKRELEEQQRLEEEERRRQQEEMGDRQRREELIQIERKVEEKNKIAKENRVKKEELRQARVAENRSRRLQGLKPLKEEPDSDEEDDTKSRPPRRNWHSQPSNSERMRRSIDVDTVPEGMVSKLINNSAQKSPREAKRPGLITDQSSIRRGLVARRLSAAKFKEEKGSLPSAFR